VRILVLDDQPEIREIISDIVHIKYEEIGIDEAATYEEAISLSNDHKYNILLVDINLGGKSGLDFIETVRTGDGQNSTTPIFVITASPSTVNEEIKKYQDTLLFNKVDGVESLTTKLSEVLDI
jgi:DNA-binding response OmpR family regulator